MYCSKACQKKDWKPRHKEICKLLNAGHGGMQVRTDAHTSRSIQLNERGERNRGGNSKQFFKLFQESTLEGSRAAAQKMKKIAKRRTKHNQKFMLFHSLHLLVRASNSEMLLWPNSPLLVLLHFAGPNMLLGNEDKRITSLHHLADLADPFDYSTHENQLILAKHFIEHDANVNAVTKLGRTPLHKACSSNSVTNLDFVELLLEAGADPNTQDHQGLTPLMFTIKFGPGAANFLLSWPTTDVNITDHSGVSFLAKLRLTITDFSDKVVLHDNPKKVQHQFLLQ
jgi:hypothetical protein